MAIGSPAPGNPGPGDDTWEHLIPQSTPDDVRAAIRFVLFLGQALHRFGFAADRVEEAMDRVGRKLRLTGQYFVTPTGIFAAFGSHERQRTFLLRVSPGDLELGKVADLQDLTRAVVAGKVSVAAGSERIQEILDEPPRYRPLLTVTGYGMTSGAAAILLGGAGREALVAAILGLLIGAMSQVASSRSMLARVFEPAAAFMAAALATAAAWPFGASPTITILSALIVLLPGLTVTVAMTELTTRNLVAGTARLSGALVLFVILAFGITLGSRAVILLAGLPPAIPPTPPGAAYTAIALLATALGFVVLMRAHARDISGIVLVGGIGFLASSVASRMGPEIGVFVGAVVMGIGANVYGKLLHRPEAVALIPGIILLVPGAVGFRSFSELAAHNTVGGLQTIFLMFMLAAALVAGLHVANVIQPPASLES